MKLSAILAPLVAAGVDAETILKTVIAYEQQQENALEKLSQADEERKAKGRERWRKWNHLLGMSRSEWVFLSEAIKQRDDFTCVYCGSRAEPLHCDHVIPLSQGGSNSPHNLATACRACNCGKSGRTPEQWGGR